MTDMTNKLIYSIMKKKRKKQTTGRKIFEEYPTDSNERDLFGSVTLKNNIV
jgi:hypothetical protein